MGMGECTSRGKRERARKQSVKAGAGQRFFVDACGGGTWREWSAMDLPPPPDLPPLPPPPGVGPGSAGQPRRPVWPWVVGGVGLLLGMIAGVAGFGLIGQRFVQDRLRRQEALREVVRVQQQNNDEQRRELAQNNESVTGAGERMTRARKALTEAAGQVGGDDRKILEAGQRMAANLQPKLTAYATAFASFRDAGLFEPKTFPNREAIAARRELLRGLNVANEDLAAAYAGIPAAFRADLRAAGISPARMEVEARAFETSAQLTDQAKLREQDRQMTQDGDALLDLLAREWGRWSVDKDGRVLFRKDDTLKRFRELAQRLDQTGKDQTQLQQRMLNRSSAPKPITR